MKTLLFLFGKTMVVKTEKEGKDDNREATLFYTLTISDTTCVMQKEFRFADEEKRVLRNEHTLMKVK